MGNPGLGKSLVARVPTAHDKRNRYESAQSSTGKTLTAVAVKEGDSVALRTGALAQAKEAVISVNEMGRLSLEEQGHFLDAAEEGEFTINKMGIHAKIRADSVIIWTSNPTQAANWSDNSGDSRIDLNDLPILKEFIDRTDVLVVFKPIDALSDPDGFRKYSRLKTEMEEHPERVPNYDDYIKSHLAVVRRYYNNVTLTKDASYILQEAHIRIQQKMKEHGLPNAGSLRILDRLVRITECIAKLKLKHQADEKDAKAAVSFYNTLYSQMHGVVTMPDNPRDVAYRQILFLLQNESKGKPVAYRELVEEACRRNPEVDRYFKGGAKNIRDNWQMQTVRELLENHSKVKRVPPMSPITYRWLGDGGGGDNGDPLNQQSSKGDESDGSDGVMRDGVQGKPVVQAQPTGQQSKESDINDNNEEGKCSVQHNSKAASLSSLSSLPTKNRDKNEIEEEYKILRTIQLAALEHKDTKAQGKESGSLFTAQDVWYHISARFPGDEWDIDKVRKAIQGQVKKGRVLSRRGDEPDRYYLIWRNNGIIGNDNEKEGEQ